MKTIYLFILLLFSFQCLASEENKRPQVCLNMIVKNESKVIERCLESAKPLIDYWIIVDTGSVDGTQEVIKECMKDIPGELFERPWVNFEHNRNEALELAKDKADYVLIIDADDKFEIEPDFTMPALDKDGYMFKVKAYGCTHYRPHLVRTDLDWIWEGVVHEGLISHIATNIGQLDGVSILIIGGGDRANDLTRFEKDANLLEEALKADPDNARSVFYLAQSYQDAGKLELSIAAYEQRAAMGGWEEEVFCSLYQIARLQERLNMPEEIVTNSYSKAYSFRPSRYEPLYRLSSYYRKKQNYPLGYLFAQLALDLKKPDDFLFVESWIYDWGILLEHSICAYWVGQYEEAFKSSYQLLLMKTLPQHVRECVENNLRFIIPKVAKEQYTFEFTIPG